MYEKLNKKPITRYRFYKRMFLHFTTTLLLIILSLGMGMGGLMYFESMPLYKAFMHTAIILSGQGLIENPLTLAGHWFVGVFGLYSGLVFIVVLSILMTPIIHRIVHKLHWEDDDSQGS